jgi:hypothetical protein
MLFSASDFPSAQTAKNSTILKIPMLYFSESTIHHQKIAPSKKRFLCRLLAAQPAGDAVAIISSHGVFPSCQRHSRGPAKLKDGFRIMFRLLYTASERVAKRAGFCVDCLLRRLQVLCRLASKLSH